MRALRRRDSFERDIISESPITTMLLRHYALDADDDFFALRFPRAMPFELRYASPRFIIALFLILAFHLFSLIFSRRLRQDAAIF